MTSIVAMAGRHVHELMRFEQELFGAEAWSADAYRDELADQRHRRYVVAVDDEGTLVGWAGVRVLADEGEILTIGVVPAARRAGIGTLLLTTLVEEAGRRGARHVYLEVRPDNAAALRLYEREGFLAAGIRRGYYDNGRTDAVIMARSLTPAPPSMVDAVRSDAEVPE